jgi:hypothetical protein
VSREVLAQYAGGDIVCSDQVQRVCRLQAGGAKDPVQPFNPTTPDSTRDAPFKITHAPTNRRLQLAAGFPVAKP